MLYQNDGFGKDLLGAFTEGIKGSEVTIVAQEPYEPTDPTVAPQVKKLAGSGADVFLNISTPKAGAQAIAAVAQSGWKPLHILNNVAASKAQVIKPVGYQYAQGILTAAYFKTPEDPQFANDGAMKSYKADIAKYAPDADPLDTYSVYGWIVGEVLVETVKKMSAPTRQALLDASHQLDLNPAAAAARHPGADQRHGRSLPDRSHADQPVRGRGLQARRFGDRGAVGVVTPTRRGSPTWAGLGGVWVMIDWWY